MSKIEVAIVGIGNCANSLIQGIHYYKNKSEDDVIGLMHGKIGGYMPGDIEVVAAVDEKSLLSSDKAEHNSYIGNLCVYI